MKLVLALPAIKRPWVYEGDPKAAIIAAANDLSDYFGKVDQ